MPKMHILMCAGFYDIAGFSKVIEYLATGLVDRGHKVTIGAFMFKRSPQKGNYDFVRIPVENPLKLVRFLENFDIIHSHHAITNYLSFISKKPFIYHYHGAPDFGGNYLYRLSLLSSIKITSQWFDSVIAVSDSGRDEFRRYSNYKKLHVIYNGVDNNSFSPRLQKKFRKGQPQFLFVGNLYEHKMVEELLLAFNRLVKDNPKVHLEIIGNGLAYQKLKKYVFDLNLSNNVTFAGRVPQICLPYHYVSCDVYVTASRYEVCPVPLLEAMACGKPIVASSINPHIDLISKSGAGLIYSKGNIADLSNKMIRAYEERDKYVDSALKFAESHDWSVITDSLLKIYHNLVYVQ